MRVRGKSKRATSDCMCLLRPVAASRLMYQPWIFTRFPDAKRPRLPIVQRNAGRHLSANPSSRPSRRGLCRKHQDGFPELADQIVENQGIISPDDEMFMPEGGRELLNFRPTVGMIAERSGVSIDDPATSKARFGASLGINPDQKALAIKNSLSKLYKQDIDVRIGSNTGELEYYNPKTKKYALVDKPGADLGDFSDLGGDAMVILPDLITTIFTAGASKAIGAGAVMAIGLRPR